MPRLPLLQLAAALAVLTVCTAGNPAARADYSEEQYKADLKLFDDAKLPHGDADLVDLFQKRLIKEADRERINALLKKLASKSFKEREQATADIINEGPHALPLLRKMMAGNIDLETKRRAERCVQGIEAK